MAAGAEKDIQTHFYILMTMINLGPLEDLLIFIFIKTDFLLFCFQTPKAGNKIGPRELSATFSN